MATFSDSAFGMALTLGDLGRDRESTLANGYLYRFTRLRWIPGSARYFVPIHLSLLPLRVSASFSS
jgi:hypothetical protein